MEQKAAAHKAAGGRRGLRSKLARAIHSEERSQRDYDKLNKSVEKYNKKTNGRFLKRAPDKVRDIKHEESTHEHELKAIEHDLP